MHDSTASDHFARQIDILWVLAHPDDESFGSAGTMLLAADEGITTGLVCATRGEVGEIRDSLLASPATLGAVREQELRSAMRLAKLTELRLLGFRDSGMGGTAPNADPRALINEPMESVTAHIVGQIRELRPRVVVTFGPDGAYGHPDHVRIGAVTDEAVVAAAMDDQPGLGTPWRVDALFHATSPREMFVHMRNMPQSPLASMTDEDIAKMGVPAADITHWIDVSSKLTAKHEILMQHLTQISRDNPLASLRSEGVALRLGRETYTRVPLPWNELDRRRADPLSALAEAFPASRQIPGLSTQTG
jgi:LmbE family N-acetylglucosaminyl deacetylase